MSELHELQFPLDQKIFTEVLNCLPKEWTRAKLEVSASGNASGGDEMAIRIDPQRQHGIAIVSDALQDAIRELFLLYKRFNNPLKGMTYSYQRRPDGRWTFVSQYSYP